MRDPSHDYLTDKHLATIAGFMPVYRWGARTVGEQTPIMLAVLHFREADLKRTAKVPGGPFQYDPGKGPDIRGRIRKHVEAVCMRYKVPYAPVNEDLSVAVLVAANHMKRKSRGRPLAIRNKGNLDRVADAFWGYNGRADIHTPGGNSDREAASWRFSPYVANDPKRGIRFRLRGTIPDGKGGRLKIDRIETRPGALVLYKELRRRLPELRAAEEKLA